MTKHQEAPAAAGGIAAKELMSIIDRVERMNEEIKGINADKADLFQETKSRGFDIRAIKSIISERAKLEKNPEAFNEMQSMVELYKSAIGMHSQIDLFNDPSS
jgi:uncharacterized protein (UPF0335 family)